MKKLNIAIGIAFLLLTAVAFSSCGLVDNGDIKIDANGNADKVISFTAEAKEITIAWGDGAIEKLTPNKITRHFFSHKFLVRNGHTIIIKADELTYFELNEAFDAEISINNCPDLKTLISKNKKKTASLAIKEAANLELLDCTDGRIESLSLKECKKLKALYCGRNFLTKLDVSRNIDLEILDCPQNYIESLDVSNNRKLQTLSCYGNLLTYLDLLRNDGLQKLFCQDNEFEAGAVKLNFNKQNIDLKPEKDSKIYFWKK